MDDASKTLPSNYNQGYCYFDVNTKKFWIDTAPNSATATEKAAGRVPLNALRADFADMGVRIPFATCSSAASAVNKIVEFGSEEVPWVGTTPPAGTMLAVYFLNANTAENPTIQLDKGFQSKQVNIHCTYLKPAGPGVSDSWDAGSVVIFTYIPATKSASHTDEWVMASYQDPTSFMETYTGPNSIEYIAGTQTSATNAWTGRTKSASLYTGKVIIYKLPQAGTSSAATLNLTLSTGATTGAKAIKLGTNGASNVTTHYGAGAHLFMIYNGTNWIISSQYDSNNYDRLQLNRAVKAASAITAGQIIVGTSAGYKPATAGTTFDITYPILYASAAIASGATATTTYLRYTSVNVATTQSSFSGTAYQSLYLKGKLNGTIFTVASITNLISEVENDDDCYIPLGILYDATHAYFYPSNQIFEYRNNKLHLVRDGRAINTITRSGNTFTATRDDGSTFTFTQKDNNTTYTFTNGTNGSFKVTPSGGSAQTVSIGKPATAGAADTASKFSSARTVELLGDVTGSESSDGTSGWSINTTIGTGKVTNNMLAGSIANSKLANSKVTIAGNDVSLGGSLATATLRSSLGLSNALHFIGVATNTITDGGTQDPGISGYNTTVNRQAGDVVLSSDTHYEYVWTGSKWELLGGDSSYKIVQTAIGDGDATVASDTVIQFVSGVTQNTNGEITVTKKNIRTATTTASGIVTLNANTTNTLINQLSTGDSVPTDGDYYIAQYVGGGTTTTTYHRRPISRLWQYIFNKLNPSWSAWTAGSSEGPKANLVLGGTTYTTPAIPAAGISASGIVNTLAQTFSGNKLFVDGVGVGVDDTSNDGLKILQVYNGGNAEYGSFTISTLGTDATVGVATLKVGNTTASGANYNAKGQLILYNTNTKGSALESKYTGSNALSTMYLPNYDSGYLTHTAGTAAVGSTTQPVYVAANGRITAITGNIANGTTGNAATASKVNNNLVIKLKSGTTEGTDLYTFNGSAAKTLDIKQGTGITLTAAAGSLTIANSGVRSIATGSTNGTISVNTNGTTADVAVKGLGSNAYTSTAYLPLAGGTMTGDITFSKPTAAGQKRGFVFSGVTDSAGLYYLEPNLSDDGRMRFVMRDNDTDPVEMAWALYRAAGKEIPGEHVVHSFNARGYTLSPIVEADGTKNPISIIPSVNNFGSVGTSSNKWADMYATTFHGALDGNATTAGTATKLGSSTVGSNVKAIYLNNGTPTASDHEFAGGYQKNNANLNTLYDAGFYSSPGGGVTNYPANGDKYAAMLVVPYRKPSGNTTPDYAFQIGNFTQANDRLWYRTSNNTTWRGWRNIVNIAANTAVGGTTTPVYVDAHGTVTALSYTIAKSVPADAKFTDTTYTASDGITLSGTNFKINDNTLPRVKLMMTDTVNYAELNDYSCGRWGFTADSTADGHWYSMNTLARDKFISDYYQCNGKETFNIQFEISTTCKGNVNNGGTDSSFRGTAIGIYTWDEAGTSTGISYSTRVTADANGTVTIVNSDVTLAAAARKFRIFIQTESWGNFSGAIKIRKLKVIRVSAPKWYGDLSGNAATATKATQDESGNNIKASYASSFSISDHTITLKNKNGASLGTVTVPDSDTKNTAGSTDISSKIFLIGATSQAANPQTYSDNEVFVTNGTLSAKNIAVSGNATLSGETSADSLTVGNLQVNGSATFVNTINGNINGNAATATNVAWSGVTGKPSTFTPSSHTHTINQVTWPIGQNLSATIPDETSTAIEWSIDLANTTKTGTYWHVWSGKNQASILQCYNDTRYVQIPVHLGIGGMNGSYKLYVNGNTLNNGTVYFANGTTYFINNSGFGYLSSASLGGLTMRAQNTNTEGGEIILAAAPGYNSGTYSAFLDVNMQHFRIHSNGAERFKVDLTTGALPLKTTFSNTTDSSHSKDTAAAVVVKGGVSVEKKVSAKEVRIDNNQSSKGVSLQYDESLEVLNFVFS